MHEQINSEIAPNAAEADWNQVFERIKQLGIPEDIHERADDIAYHFSSGEDIEMLGKAIHDVLVPGVVSMATERTMKAIDPAGGRVERYFARPEERAAVYDSAAKHLQELSNMRGSAADDAAFLTRAANVVALAVTQAHSYENGNGRLSRVMAELIRFGTANRDDLILLGTERDLSQKRMNGFRINGYRQIGQSIERRETDADVLRIAASTDIPLSRQDDYAKRAEVTFSSPHGYKTT